MEHVCLPEGHCCYREMLDTPPLCDFCKQQGKTNPAFVDGRTKHGPWGYMCNDHFVKYGSGLGLGKGQQIIQEEVKK
jgi:hypothetical protein